MLDRVFCTSSVNWWCDSDCERHLVTEYNLVRFYRNGTVISRRVELRQQAGSCADAAEDYQPEPFPFRDAAALNTWIDRDRPETYSLEGTYSVQDDRISLRLRSTGPHDIRIARWDLKYVAHDTDESMFLQPGSFEGTIKGDEIVLADRLVLRALRE